MSLLISQVGILIDAVVDLDSSFFPLPFLLPSHCLWLDDTIPEQSVPSLPERASSFEEGQPSGENDELSDENEASESNQPPSPELKEQMESQYIQCYTK